MRSYATSIPAPPYALSDVGAKDCVGERYAIPVSVHMDGESVALHRLPRGEGQGLLRRLTESEGAAERALGERRREGDCR
jgi:hypothetical protein